MSSPQEAFGLSCPSGGKFYICEGAKTEFIGCCDSDPCKSGKCPEGDLYPASFSSNMDSYDQIGKQSCDDSEGDKIWYTCAANFPPFMGCCKDNACANGNCSSEDLVPAKLASSGKSRKTFLHPGDSSATSSPDPDDGGGGGLSTGAIAGIAVGVAVVVLAVAGILFYKFCWLPRRRRNDAPPQYQPPSNMQQPTSAMTFNSHQSPMSQYQQQFSPAPTAVSSFPGTDGYNKFSPQPSPYERPYSYDPWTDPNAQQAHAHPHGVHPQGQVSPQYGGSPHIPVEMDGTAHVQELPASDTPQGTRN